MRGAPIFLTLAKDKSWSRDCIALVVNETIDIDWWTLQRGVSSFWPRVIWRSLFGVLQMLLDFNWNSFFVRDPLFGSISRFTDQQLSEISRLWLQQATHKISAFSRHRIRSKVWERCALPTRAKSCQPRVLSSLGLLKRARSFQPVSGLVTWNPLLVVMFKNLKCFRVRQTGRKDL